MYVHMYVPLQFREDWSNLDLIICRNHRTVPGTSTVSIYIYFFSRLRVANIEIIFFMPQKQALYRVKFRKFDAV